MTTKCHPFYFVSLMKHNYVLWNTFSLFKKYVVEQNIMNFDLNLDSATYFLGKFS